MQGIRLKKPIRISRSQKGKDIEIPSSHEHIRKSKLTTPPKFTKSFVSTTVSDAHSSQGSPSLPAFNNGQNANTRSILTGDFEEIQPPKQALVRIYFCSNPKDSTLERQVLWNKSIPNLQKHCQEKHDIECQVLDLNAGPDEGALITKEDRIREINLCRQRSLSTCFISLVGHKYWSPSIPRRVDARLFGIFLKIAYDAPIQFPNARLLEKYYERDENATEPVYTLKHGTPVSNLLTMASSAGRGICKNLQDIMHKLATAAWNIGEITKEQADVFLLSNLHAELVKGLETDSKRDASRCVSYLRSINYMDSDMNYNRILPYLDVLNIDVDPSTPLYVTEDMLDLEAQSKLILLREQWIPSRIAAADGEMEVYKCDVTWTPKVGLTSEKQKEYLEDLSHQFQSAVMKTAANDIGRIQKYTSCLGEVLCHCLIAKHICQHHCELSTDAISSIHKYVTGSSTSPYILYGSKGSGKTYVMAAAAYEAAGWFNGSDRPTCVMRFLGHTCTSSYVLLLLSSLCSQLEKCFNQKDAAADMWCTDVTYHRNKLARLLESCTNGQPVVIFLDGLENLTDFDDYPDIWSWLPANLSNNVKLVLSIDSESSGFQRINGTAKDFNLNLVHLPLLSQKEYSTFLRQMLSNKNRRMTTGQHVFAVHRAIANSGLERPGPDIQATPCMAQVVFTHAVRWTSSKDVSQSTVGQSEVDAIRQYMVLLQQRHGVHLVQVTARLVTMSLYGITELELQKVLSTYKSIQLEMITKLQDQTAVSFGDIDSVLSVSLLHLLDDLSFLLLPKLMDGCQVYCWSNSIIRATMKSLYLSSSDSVTLTRVSLIQYYSNYLDDGNYPTNQEVPLKTTHVVLELQFHLQNVKNEKKAMQLFYKNLFWISAMTRSLDIVHTLFFLGKAYKLYQDRSLLVLERALRLILNLLHQTLDVLPGELYSRVTPLLCNFPSLSTMVSQCILCRSDITALIPASIHAQPPGAPLRMSLAETEKIASVFVYKTNTTINLAYCSEKRFKMFDMVNGELLRELAFLEPIEWMKITKDNKFIIMLSGREQILFILEEKTSQCIHKISLEKYFNTGFKTITVKDIEVAVSTELILVWVRNGTQALMLFDLTKATLRSIIPCEEKVHTCLISCDDKYIYAVNLPRTIIVFSAITAGRVCRLEPAEMTHGGEMVNLFENWKGHLLTIFSVGIIQVWKTSKDERFIHAFELDSRSTDPKQSSEVVIHSSISNDKRWLVVVKSTETDIWNLKTWKIHCEIRPRKNEIFESAYFTNKQNFLLVTFVNDYSVYIWNISSLGQCCFDVTLSSARRLCFDWILDAVINSANGFLFVEHPHIRSLHRASTMERELQKMLYPGTPYSESPVKCISMLDGHTHAICNALAPKNMSNGDLYWVVTLSVDNCIKTWNLENLPLINSLTMTGRSITKIFCLGHFVVTGDNSEKITVWNISNSDIAFQLKHEAPVEHCISTVWKPKLVTADKKGYQYVWDLETTENLFKIKGPPVYSLLLTCNEQMIISVFKNGIQSDERNEASKVWRLDSAQVTCTFNYALKQPQVTSRNTFLVGISNDGKLHAVSLWTGLLAKVLWTPNASITLIHPLTGQDFVLSLDTNNHIIIWSLSGEAKVFSLDMKNIVMNQLCISDSGSILTMTDADHNIKALDIKRGNVRRVKAFGQPVLMKITRDGLHIVYVSRKTVQENSNATADFQYYLVVMKTTSNRIMSIYPLESTPTSLHIEKTDQNIAIGLEEGRMMVFTIIGPDTKPNYPKEHEVKSTTRKIFHSKEGFDQVWISTEPKYEFSHPLHASHDIPSSTTNSPESPNGRAAITQPGMERHHFTSVHMPRNKGITASAANKSVNMSRISNSSKVKVFM